MLKDLVLPLLAVAIFVSLVGYLVKNPQKLSFFLGQNNTSQYSKVVEINGNKIEVVVADTDEKRKVGLADTKSLNSNQGMLFIFPTKDVKPTFWMKDMEIDIDIIWINDNKIVQIDKNVKAPDATTIDAKLETFKATNPIDYVLEVPAMYSDRNKIKVGDSVLIN